MTTTKTQQHASEKLFMINPSADKCLRLNDEGLLEFVPDETEFTEELGITIVEMLFEGFTILEIAGALEVSVDKIFDWRTPSHADYNESFEKAYAMADFEAGDILESESLETAFDRSSDYYSDYNKDGLETRRPNSANVQRSRLQTETFEKIAETKNPAKHGKKPEDNNTELDLKFVIQMVPTEAPIRIEAIPVKEIEAPKVDKEETCQ